MVVIEAVTYCWIGPMLLMGDLWIYSCIELLDM